MLEQKSSHGSQRENPGLSGEQLADMAATGVQKIRSAVADAPRPVFVAAAAIGGAVLLFGAFRLFSAPRRRAAWLAPQPPPSLFRSILRSALISAASALASRFAGQLALPAPTAGAAPASPERARATNLHGS